MNHVRRLRLCVIIVLVGAATAGAFLKPPVKDVPWDLFASGKALQMLPVNAPLEFSLHSRRLEPADEGGGLVEIHTYLRIGDESIPIGWERRVVPKGREWDDTDPFRSTFMIRRDGDQYQLLLFDYEMMGGTTDLDRVRRYCVELWKDNVRNRRGIERFKPVMPLQAQNRSFGK